MKRGLSALLAGFTLELALRILILARDTPPALSPDGECPAFTLTRRGMLDSFHSKDEPPLIFASPARPSGL